MEEVIHGTTAGYKDMTKADRLAIARYLKSIPADPEQRSGSRRHNPLEGGSHEREQARTASRRTREVWPS